jgi:FdrA protein
VSIPQVRVFPGTYRDSLLLLSATRAMQDESGVNWAAAVMATPANVEDLADRGISAADLDGADANALVLAVQAPDAPTAGAALQRGHDALFAGGSRGSAEPGQPDPRSVGEAAARLPEANVAVVSVPGPYAAITAHQALSAGLHVLLFSDNVPLADEVILKERASRLGRLVMGPGAGTAMLGGVGLGFANVVRPGRVGVVAAAGTGAQEVMTLLDRWEIGVSCVIGVGGRDLSSGVGGRMAADAVRVLDNDPGTEVILLVSKPPDPAVARRVIGASKHTAVIAACLGLPELDGLPAEVPLAATLEEGVMLVARALAMPVPDLTQGLADAVEAALARTGGAPRGAVRGFFTGGTLCYEAQIVLSRSLGPVYSNIPLRPDLGCPLWVPTSAWTWEGVHARCRHPMIDPSARRRSCAAEVSDDDVAVVLLDVVLRLRIPSGSVARSRIPAPSSSAMSKLRVAYVLGTRGDPQDLDAQSRTLCEAGAIVTQTSAQAARVAAAIAGRRPDLATASP